MSFFLHGSYLFHRLNLGIVHVHDLVSADWLGPETLEASGFRFDRMHGPQVDSLFVCTLGRRQAGTGQWRL
jgi:hypothetical protein